MSLPRAIPVLFCLVTVASSATFVESMQAGLDGYNKGRYEEALTHFARARSIAPRRWEGHAWQALTQIQQAILERKDMQRGGRR